MLFLDQLVFFIENHLIFHTIYATNGHIICMITVCHYSIFEQNKNINNKRLDNLNDPCQSADPTWNCSEVHSCKHRY